MILEHIISAVPRSKTKATGGRGGEGFSNLERYSQCCKHTATRRPILVCAHDEVSRDESRFHFLISGHSGETEHHPGSVRTSALNTGNNV